jgi:hypothetical protein
VIERFNFYDLYGYAFPGLALIMMLVAPFTIAFPWPKGDTIAAAVLIVLFAALSYFVGHLLQTFGAVSFRSTAGNRNSYPHSTLLLDKSNHEFSDDFKWQLGKRVRSWFQLDVAVDRDADDNLKNIRQEAFIMARTIVNVSSGYGEQQEGMYVLMRGLAVACLLGFAYTFGWWLQPSAMQVAWLAPSLPLVILSVLTASAFAVIAASTFAAKRFGGLALYGFAVWLFAIGFELSARRSCMPVAQQILLALWLVYLVGFTRFYGAYAVFAKTFARTVWNHFGAEPRDRPSK